MTEAFETPIPDESLKACFIAYDHIQEGIIEMMAFCSAASEHGPVEWQEEALKAHVAGEFVALFWA